MIPIRTDISVGNIVELIIPEPEVMDDTSNNKDAINDNRYLVADLCLSANIQKGEGILILECLKESYAQKIETDILNQIIHVLCRMPVYVYLLFDFFIKESVYFIFKYNTSFMKIYVAN